jgi:hypothetical protein
MARERVSLTEAATYLQAEAEAQGSRLWLSSAPYVKVIELPARRGREKATTNTDITAAAYESRSRASVSRQGPALRAPAQ